jgi:hypothetical protein
VSGRRLFAAVRGLAGAALGVYLALRLWIALGFALRALRLETSLVVLGPLLLCPAAYLGYGCFRGLRERRFAYGAAWGCAFLALPLAARPDSPAGWLGVCLLSALFVLLSRFLGREMFLRYMDPAWYKDPRRAAARYGRGRLSHHWHVISDFGRPVPGSFCVNDMLHVQGDTIRSEPRLRRGRTFLVQDVAGAILAPGVGHCVLYNRQDETLAVFRISGRNGELFVKYLKSHDVPFRRLTEVPPTGPLALGETREPGKPGALGEAVREAVCECAAELEAGPEREEAVLHTDLGRYSAWDAQDFSLELRRTRPIGAWIGAGMLLTIAVFPIGFPIAALLGEGCIIPGLKIMVALVFVLLAGPWVWAAAGGELFPPRLSVECGHIWLDKGLLPLREIRLEDIGGLRYDRSDECYILHDKQGKTLVKFSTRDACGSRFMNFLTDHGITLLK